MSDDPKATSTVTRVLGVVGGLAVGALVGAIAMGMGLALFEEERYALSGAPLSTDFKRYLLPRLPDLPRLRTGQLVSPSPFTELGTKGAGEGGVGGSAAAIIGAVRDAIGSTNSPVHVPLTPARVLADLDSRLVGATR